MFGFPGSLSDPNLWVHPRDLPDSTVSRRTRNRFSQWVWLTEIRSAVSLPRKFLGTRRAEATAVAIQTAEKIGKVTVDMGDTSCQVPDAQEYIRKVQSAARLGRSARRRRVSTQRSEADKMFGFPGSLSDPNLWVHPRDLPDSTVSRRTRNRCSQWDWLTEIRSAVSLPRKFLGTRRADAAAVAIQTAEKIGKVTVDMGDTACQVPDAKESIRKVQKRGTIGKKRKTAKG